MATLKMTLDALTGAYGKAAAISVVMDLKAAGLVIVPGTPTKQMIEAGCRVAGVQDAGNVAEIWETMLLRWIEGTDG